MGVIKSEMFLFFFLKGGREVGQEEAIKLPEHQRAGHRHRMRPETSLLPPVLINLELVTLNQSQLQILHL